jgi:hypothetical protein
MLEQFCREPFKTIIGSMVFAAYIGSVVAVVYMLDAFIRY